MSNLIEAANEIDVLSAPINIPSHINSEDDNSPPKHIAKDVIDNIRQFRNLIHSTRALRESCGPEDFHR